MLSSSNALSRICFYYETGYLMVDDLEMDKKRVMESNFVHLDHLKVKPNN